MGTPLHPSDSSQDASAAASAPASATASAPASRMQRLLRLPLRLLGALRLSQSHTAATATLLLMVSATLSRLIGLVRVKYIALLFGRGMAADALNAAFVLPDMLSYFLVGGTASITFVTILTRYRDSGREAEGERSLSVILTTMLLVLGTAIVVAEFAAPIFIHAWFPGFDAQKSALCVLLTRILLPAQICFFAGGVFGAVLLVRKQFTAQAFSGLIYNLGTIVGGLLLARLLGVSSLAIGTVAGAIAGPLLLNVIGAWRAGTRYRPILDFRDEGLREWVRLSIPLMVGVSLVTADNWIISHFASRADGAVSMMTYAKQMFTAPMAVLAQAAGAASMPFFANLWAQRRHEEFATQVAASVTRVTALGLLAASAMIPMGPALIDLVLLGGRFRSADTAQTALYFTIFSVTLCLWSAQAIYARSFYAAGNTLTPMLAGTIITVASFPIYALLFRLQGAVGLALASDIGITLQTLTLATLLHRRRMVLFTGLDRRELMRSAVAGTLAGATVWAAITLTANADLLHGRLLDAAQVALGTLIWLVVAGLLLQTLGSPLPRVLLRRLGRL